MGPRSLDPTSRSRASSSSQELFTSASNAPVTEFDSTPWVNINNNDATGKPEAATIIAPGWAHWSIGDLAPDPEDATKTVATWNDDVFGIFVLPGVDGGVAPVFAGGSNIAISAASKNQAGAKELLKIIFSEEYQTMLGENGLGPANLDYASRARRRPVREGAHRVGCRLEADPRRTRLGSGRGFGPARGVLRQGQRPAATSPTSPPSTTRRSNELLN